MTAVRTDESLATMDLGAAEETTKPFDDIPYGLVMRFKHEAADVYWMYSTEHTDLGAVEEMWTCMPGPLTYQYSEQCPRVPADFRGSARIVIVHFFIAHRKGVRLAEISPAFFFATKIVR